MIGGLTSSLLSTSTDERLGYPTQKPRSLYERILQNASILFDKGESLSLIHSAAAAQR